MLDGVEEDNNDSDSDHDRDNTLDRSNQEGTVIVKWNETLGNSMATMDLNIDTALKEMDCHQKHEQQLQQSSRRQQCIQLPIELLQMIATMVVVYPIRHLRPARTVASLCMVSRYWNQSLSPLLWTNLTLQPAFLARPSFNSWAQNLIAHPAQLQRYTRRIAVRQQLPSQRDHSELVLAIVHAALAVPTKIYRLVGLSLSGIRLDVLSDIAQAITPLLASLSLLDMNVDLRSLRTDIIPLLSRPCGLSKQPYPAIGSALTHLSLANVSSIDDQTLTEIAYSCPGITSLCVAKCVLITDVGVKSIAEACSGLVSLDMAGTSTTPAAVASVAALRGSQLRRLSIASCPLRKADALPLAEALMGLLCLESLDVSDTAAGWPALAIALVPTTSNNNNATITTTTTTTTHPSPANDSSLCRFLPTHFVHLQHLRFGWHGFLEEQAFRHLFSRLHALTHLWISDSVSISPRALQNILSRCPLLTHLHLPSLKPTMSPSAVLLPPSTLINLFSSKTTPLTWISLVGHTVTPSVLRSLGLSCPSLVYVNLSLSRARQSFHTHYQQQQQAHFGEDTALTRAVLGEFILMARKLQVLRCAGLGLNSRDVRWLARSYPQVCIDDCIYSLEIDWDQS
ncbi:hypothetical protein BSLG_004810 [Batrachochytrium salamandrivorans]|nr:hypothetical protein BSLG_004810 [Batrachochytrium salamandrivorans]